MLFSERVVAWYRHHGRHDLPWQQNITPYSTWVSEVMLQQTTVQTVLKYFDVFMQRFPNIETLAKSDLQEVLSYWAGLGYYRRARYLHLGAQHVVTEHHGLFPSNYDEIVKIPGIGASTAGAILSLAFNAPGTILDGNVKRVLVRHIGIPDAIDKPSTMKQLWQHAKSLSPKQCHKEYSQGMMDLGATRCHKRDPECTLCPLNKDCYCFKHNAHSQIPGKNIRKKVKTMNLYPVIITDGHSIVLEKQAPDGLWADMWLLPNLDKKNDEAVPLTTFQHVLTHFRITVQPFLLKIDSKPSISENQRWTNIDDASTPKPKIVDKCIKQAIEHLKKM